MVRDLAALDRNSVDNDVVAGGSRALVSVSLRPRIGRAPHRLRAAAVEALKAGGLRSARKEVEVEKLRRKLKGTREEEVDQA